jgi:hypothetical protein
MASLTVAVEPEDLVLLGCRATIMNRCHPLALRISGHDVDGRFSYSPWSGQNLHSVRSGGCEKLRFRDLPCH